MGDSRVNKGHSRLILPKDYCVVDIETTGLSPSDCEVIELSAVRYRQLKKIDSFHTLVISAALNVVIAFIAALPAVRTLNHSVSK